MNLCNIGDRIVVSNFLCSFCGSLSRFPLFALRSRCPPTVLPSRRNVSVVVFRLFFGICCLIIVCVVSFVLFPQCVALATELLSMSSRLVACCYPIGDGDAKFLFRSLVMAVVLYSFAH